MQTLLIIIFCIIAFLLGFFRFEVYNWLRKILIREKDETDYIGMLEEINAQCQDSVSITKYQMWQLNSYHDGTKFNSFGKSVEAPTLKELIRKAYKML